MSSTAVVAQRVRLSLVALVPLALFLTSYLYLYPVFHQCAFPLPPSPLPSSPPPPSSVSNAAIASDNGPAQEVDEAFAAFLDTAQLHLSPRAWRRLEGWLPDARRLASRPGRRAPFRLLTLGDPQLEGDTSIPNVYGPWFPHWVRMLEHLTFRSHQAGLRERLRQAAHELVDFYFEDVPNFFEGFRKRIDLFGNDFYLAHVYRTMHWWTRPTHVTVLGDLVGSQWIDDAEFDRRGKRFWERVFKGSERVPDDVAQWPAEEYDLAGLLGGNDSTADVWGRRIINIAGNHDIGYAGDLTWDRLKRFERVFGKANYELRFEMPVEDPELAKSLYDNVNNTNSNRLPPEIRIVVLNDMNLDTPAWTPEIQDQTYSFVNSVINTASAVEYVGHFTLILTHIPLYKPPGVCVDSPWFDFHVEWEGGGIREQNQLSQDASKGFLEGLLGMSGSTTAAGRGKGRRGLILNGHDHEGCDTYHFVNQSDVLGPLGEGKPWKVDRWGRVKKGEREGRDGERILELEEVVGVREVTVRSMMGDYGGNAGLLSMWFDEEKWEWRFEYSDCQLGKQHVWWLVHLVDAGVIAAVVFVLGESLARRFAVLERKEAGGGTGKQKTNGRVRA